MKNKQGELKSVEVKLNARIGRGGKACKIVAKILKNMALRKLKRREISFDKKKTIFLDLKRRFHYHEIQGHDREEVLRRKIPKFQRKYYVNSKYMCT